MIDPKKLLDSLSTYSSDSSDLEEGALLGCIGAEEKTPFSDNVFTKCCLCGRPVQHRPHVPKNAKPHCMKCVTELARDARELGEKVTVSVTDKTRAEIEAWLKRRDG